MEPLAVRLDEGLNGDIVGNVVSSRAIRKEEKNHSQRCYQSA
jgi:hypothetical protein